MIEMNVQSIKMDSTTQNNKNNIQPSQIGSVQNQPQQNSNTKFKIYIIGAVFFLIIIILIGTVYFFQQGQDLKEKNQLQVFEDSTKIHTIGPNEGVIAFDRDKAVYLYDFEAKQEKKITPDDGEYRVGRWSPDGSKVFVTKYPEDLYMYIIETAQLVPFAIRAGQNASGTWSLDGKYVAVDTCTYITRGLQFFTASGTKLGEGYGVMGDRWSPDSIHSAAGIIFRNPNREIFQPNLGIITMGETTTTMQILKEAGYQYAYQVIGWKSDNELVYSEQKYSQPIPDLNDDNYEEVMEIGKNYTETYWSMTLDGQQINSISEKEALLYDPYHREKALRELLPKEIIGSLASDVGISPDEQWVTFSGGEYPNHSIYIAAITDLKAPTRLVSGLQAMWRPVLE